MQLKKERLNMTHYSFIEHESLYITLHIICYSRLCYIVYRFHYENDATITQSVSK